MFEIQADRRRLAGSEDPEAEALFLSGSVAILEGEVVAARALERVQRSRCHLLSGQASAIDWAVATGMDRSRATELLRVGLALVTVDTAEADLRSGRFTTQALAEVGRLVQRAQVFGLPRPDPGDDPGSAPGGGVERPPPSGGPDGSLGSAAEPDSEGSEGDRTAEESAAAAALTRSAEELLELAQRRSRWTVRREVHRRIESHVAGEPVVRMEFHVPESFGDVFHRARVLAQRSADKVLTDGQVLAVAVTDYVARHDPLLQPAGKRRVGPTCERPGDRYVPAAVKRAVLDRSGDRCEFAGCGNEAFLQLAHVQGHSAQGDREFGNLLNLCTTHHTLLDAGHLRVVELGAAGPVFVVVESGELIGAERGSEARAPPD